MGWWALGAAVVQGVFGLSSAKKNKPAARPTPPPPKITYNYISDIDRDKMVSNIKENMALTLKDSLRTVMGVEMAKTGMRLGTSYSRVSDAQAKLITMFADKETDLRLNVAKLNQAEAARIDQINNDYQNQLHNIQTESIKAQEIYDAERRQATVGAITGIVSSLSATNKTTDAAGNTKEISNAEAIWNSLKQKLNIGGNK